jgi:hypothetical protein
MIKLKKGMIEFSKWSDVVVFFVADRKYLHNDGSYYEWGQEVCSSYYTNIFIEDEDLEEHT